MTQSNPFTLNLDRVQIQKHFSKTIKRILNKVKINKRKSKIKRLLKISDSKTFQTIKRKEKIKKLFNER